MFWLSLFELIGFLLSFLFLVRLFASAFSDKSRSLISKHPFRHAAWFLFIILFWSGYGGNTLGFLAAKVDLAQGKYHLHGCTLQGPLKLKLAYCRILRERYNISCPPLRGCIVLTNNTINSERYYDSIVASAVIARFQRDIFKECELAARHEIETPEKSRKR